MSQSNIPQYNMSQSNMSQPNISQHNISQPNMSQYINNSFTVYKASSEPIKTQYNLMPNRFEKLKNDGNVLGIMPNLDIKKDGCPLIKKYHVKPYEVNNNFVMI